MRTRCVWALIGAVALSGCYYSGYRYIPRNRFANELVEIDRDDPVGSFNQFIQFGLHIHNLDTNVIDLRLGTIILRGPNGLEDTAFAPFEIWDAEHAPGSMFVANDPQTGKLVWNPSPEDAVALCFRSISLAPNGAIDRVVVFDYPAGLRIPNDDQLQTMFTIEIEGTVSNGEFEQNLPELTWQANGFTPTMWGGSTIIHTR